MLKFKNNDRVKVNNKLNIRWEDKEQEKRLIGEIGVIVEALENSAYPYQIKFDDDKIQEINLDMGSRLFDEYELDFA